MIELRDYQVNAVTAARDAYAAGIRHVLLVGPTGMGKGVIIAWVAERHISADPNNTVLVVVHRTVLVQDLEQRIGALGLPSTKVRIESVQGLLAAVKAGRALPAATLLIFDEAHHYVADEWKAVLAHYPTALVLGFTATPVRADKRPMSPPFERMVVVAQTHELQAKGVLVDCDVIGPAKVLKNLAEHPVVAYQKHAAGRRAVVFCQDVAHAQALAVEFNAAGIAAASIEADTPEADRARILGAFRAGDIRVVTNVFLLTEGFDDPGIEVCILARGCDHVGAFLQMVGRVLRIAPGKSRALLIDLRGAVRQHGMPSDPREFHLTGKPIRSLKALAPLMQCRPCGATFRAGPPACPRCGAKAPPPPRPRVKREDLQAIRAVDPVDKRRALYASLVAKARAQGHKPGRAAFIFKSIYGHWPPAEVTRGV